MNFGYVYAQSDIRVNGSVRNYDYKTPIKNVLVLVNDEFKCYTNVDGQFSIVVPRDAQLKFTHPNYEDNVLSVNGKQEIKVFLNEKRLELDLDEVVVTSTIKRKKVGVEQTEIDVRGQYLHLATKYFVPVHLFKTDYRFVAQPVIIDKTADTTYILRPVVLNGDKYELIQHRWLNYGESPDPLMPYVEPNSMTKEHNIYSYADSVLISPTTDPTLEHEYYSNCYLALVTYHEPPISLDTVTIARGLVDPARHFDYQLEPMQLNETMLEKGVEPYLVPTGKDTVYIPEYELKLQQVSGAAHIAFGNNSKSLNYDDKVTKDKIKEIQSFLEMLQNNPDATIKKISITGYASPEGIYARNLELAKERTDEVQRIILSTLDKEMLKYVDLSTNSYVEAWSRVADLVKDEYPELSEKIIQIEKRSKGNFDVANSQIVSLPEYKTILKPNYLYKLRSVAYNIDYSMYMPLGYEAVKEKYSKGEELSRYEYYVLISNEKDESLIPSMEIAALKAFPNFIIFANRKAINQLRHDTADLNILDPVLKLGDAPMPIVYNQAAMALKADSVTLADSLVNTINVSKETDYLRNVVKVLSGDFEGAYSYFAAEETLNKVILLLAMERDKEAKATMDNIMAIPENQHDAKHCYIYAICGNRVEDFNVAMAFLQQAILLEPSYEEIVSKDADLLDIYKLLNTQNDGNNE